MVFEILGGLVGMMGNYLADQKADSKVGYLDDLVGMMAGHSAFQKADLQVGNLVAYLVVCLVGVMAAR